MQKILFGLDCTLDGFIAGLNGEDVWVLADRVFVGRITYQVKRRHDMITQMEGA